MSRSLIQFSHLFLSFGLYSLFEGISLSISEGEVFALIGENGAGKTTLLRLFAGDLFPDTGELSRAGFLRVGFLTQEITFEDTEQIVLAYIEEGELSKIERQMDLCLENNQLSEWAAWHEKYEELGGYQKIPLEKVLQGLNIETHLLKQSVDSLSGGQKIRVALAKALCQNPDLLLLDEPTNHLDAESIVWLEKTLRDRKGATVITSHDRKFLNNVCNRLIEIHRGKLSRYGGSYDFYLQEREKEELKQIKTYEAQKEERIFLEQKIKAVTFKKKKTPPPSDRNKMAYDHRGEQHQKSLQRGLDTLKARLADLESNLIPHPRPKSITGLKFIPQPLASSVAMELQGLTKAFGNKTLFSDFTKILCNKDRIILKGANGSGKTTLLGCLAGLTSLDAGRIRITPSAKIAYLDQEVNLLPRNKTPLAYFGEKFQLSEEALRREIHKSAIGGEGLIKRPFATLSVGQRKRLMLLSLILEKPNILLLDEPTNHLDFLTIEAFEEALLHFEGAILTVSHDSTFIEKMATQEWGL